MKIAVFADKRLVAVHVVELYPGGHGVALGRIEDIPANLGIAAWGKANGEAGQAEGKGADEAGGPPGRAKQRSVIVVAR